MMKRREFITGLGSGRHGRWRRVGSKVRLHVGFLRYAAPNAAHLVVFRHGLRDLGYTEGLNLDHRGTLCLRRLRSAAYTYRRIDCLEVRRNRHRWYNNRKGCSIAANPVPIVFTLAADPVADGLAVSMSRPGGNFTGLTFSVGYEVAGKRVDLLKEVVPGVSRVAVLANPANPTNAAYLASARTSSSTLGLQDSCRSKCLRPAT